MEQKDQEDSGKSGFQMNFDCLDGHAINLLLSFWWCVLWWGRFRCDLMAEIFKDVVKINYCVSDPHVQSLSCLKKFAKEMKHWYARKASGIRRMINDSSHPSHWATWKILPVPLYLSWSQFLQGAGTNRFHKSSVAIWKWACQWGHELYWALHFFWLRLTGNCITTSLLPDTRKLWTHSIWAHSNGITLTVTFLNVSTPYTVCKWLTCNSSRSESCKASLNA